MSTQIDWQGELDRAIEHVPGPPAAAYVASGRHAVRRRRATQAAAGLGTAAVLTALAWAAVPGGWTADGSRDRESQVATGGASPSEGASAEATERPDRPGSPIRSYRPAARVVAGEVSLLPGTVVHERRDDIFPGTDIESAALDLTHDGQRAWFVLEWDDSGSAGSFSFPEAGRSFDDFVADNVAGGPTLQVGGEGGRPQPTLASLTTEGLEVADGVRVVRRVDNPFELEAPETSVGLVLEHDGTTTWMTATAGPGGSLGSSERADRSGWLTFDQWLAEQVALHAGETGLRLVRMDEDGNVVPDEPGVEVLHQVADPAVPGYLTPSTTASAAAMLTWRGDTWFVLVVRDGDEDMVIPFAATKADGASTVPEFLDFVRERSDDGGLR